MRGQREPVVAIERLNEQLLRGRGHVSINDRKLAYKAANSLNVWPLRALNLRVHYCL